MESLSNREDVKRIPFTIHWPFILRLYIEKCYEEICELEIPHKYVKKRFFDEECNEYVEYTEDEFEGIKDQIQAKCDVYPLDEVYKIYRNMPDNELMGELEKYMSKQYPDADAYNVEIEDIKNFAQSLYDQYKQTEEYADARLKNMLRMYTMYVYDANSKQIEFVRFGEHFTAVKKFVAQYFLETNDDLDELDRSYLKFGEIPVKMYAEADDYIAKYIIIKGSFNCKESYRFGKKICTKL